jgi:2-polyprenyl-3-methyl-5-hydroxy-6-metoxy-1,4-benzoquinol methylase
MPGIERQTVTSLNQVEPLHLERYRIAAEHVENLNVLDAACGCGYGSLMLSVAAKSVLGVDYSEEAVEFARKYWAGPGVSYAIRNLEKSWDVLPGAKFDAVVSLETLEHLDTSFGAIFRQIASVLNDGGLLIYSHPIMETVKRGGPHKKFMLKVDEVLAVAKLRGFDHVDTVIQKNDRMPYDHAVVIVRKRG